MYNHRIQAQGQYKHHMEAWDQGVGPGPGPEDPRVTSSKETQIAYLETGVHGVRRKTA